MISPKVDYWNPEKILIQIRKIIKAEPGQVILWEAFDVTRSEYYRMYILCVITIATLGV